MYPIHPASDRFERIHHGGESPRIDSVPENEAGSSDKGSYQLHVTYFPMYTEYGGHCEFALPA
jgi:hypothetical protein